MEIFHNKMEKAGLLPKAPLSRPLVTYHQFCKQDREKLYPGTIIDQKSINFDYLVYFRQERTYNFFVLVFF